MADNREAMTTDTGGGNGKRIKDRPHMRPRHDPVFQQQARVCIDGAGQVLGHSLSPDQLTRAKRRIEY